MSVEDMLAAQLPAEERDALADEHDEDLVGFYAAVRRRMGFSAMDWTTPDFAGVLAELDRRLAPTEEAEQSQSPTAAARPEQLPTRADLSVAAALHTSRPSAAPWMSLPVGTRRSLGVAAVHVRRALQRAGWAAPAVLPGVSGEVPE